MQIVRLVGDLSKAETSLNAYQGLEFIGSFSGVVVIEITESLRTVRLENRAPSN